MNSLARCTSVAAGTWIAEVQASQTFERVLLCDATGISPAFAPCTQTPDAGT
jgi:hypothetical protein